ncbi:MAG: HupE/UreJ family protein [Rhodospirillales bacterium]
MRAPLPVFPVAACLLFAAPPAWAHGPPPGIGGFMFGLQTPFILIEQVLATLALGLLLGAQPHGVLKFAGLAYLCALLLALGTLEFIRYPVRLIIPVLSAGALIGLWIAIARPVPRGLAVMIAASLGIMIGLAYVPPPNHWLQIIPMTAGAYGCLVLLLTAAGGVAALLHAPRKSLWPAVGLRVLGSWLAAVALFMLALWARG